MREQVGTIQSYPVFYIPEKDMIFCKNTACKVSLLKEALDSPLQRVYIEEKNLSIFKDQNTLYFGCLTTTMQNIREIEQVIKTFKKPKK